MNTSNDKSESSGGGAGSTLGALYGVLLTVLGIVLPIIFFVGGESTGTGLYLSIFHLYIYTLSLFFLLYIQVCLLSRKKKKSASFDDCTDSVDFEVLPNVRENDTLPKNVDPDCTGKDDNSHVNDEKNPLDGPASRRNEPSYSHTGNGVHFFLRLGVIVFGMGCVVLDGFRLLQFVESRDVWRCYGHFYLAHIALRLVFVFAQTFFIFKNHKLVVNFKKPAIQFGLVHLIATNLCVWSMTVVMETAETYFFFRRADEALGKTVWSIPRIHRPDRPTPDPNEIQGPLFMNMSKDVHAICHKKVTLADQAAPYLYPCAVAFSIIAGAVLCRILCHVGCSIYRGPRVPPDRHRGICHKANKGLFLGLVVIVGTCISTCFFLLYNQTGQQPLNNLTTVLLFSVEDIVVMAVSLLILFIAFCKFRRLGTGEVDDRLNQTLLFLGVSGYYLLYVCIFIPFIQHVTADGVPGLLAKFALVICILGCIQATAQVTFIVDGLRRRAATRHQIKLKPGRSLITFLLISNLAMWVIDSFQLKEIHSLPLLRWYYGNLTWQIIMHLFLPLAILFRFHSSVCFATIWAMAYKKRPTRTISFNESDENRM